MADSALSVLQHEGEKRAAAGHVPDVEDFDEHLRFYKGAVRFTRTVIILLAILLLGMYFFLVR